MQLSIFGQISRFRSTTIARTRSLAVTGALVCVCLPAFAATPNDDQADFARKLQDAVPAGVRLVVAEQNDQFSVPWKISGLGEHAPYNINFANFNGGPAVLEALVAGAVDVGFIGEAPLPIALAAGVKDLKVIAAIANPGSPGNIFLVAQPGSNIKNATDLAGKSIAYPPGTGRHMILSGILHSAGLDIRKDIRSVALAGSEVAPTFASRSVDAAIVLGQQLFRLGSPPIIEDGTGHNWGLNVLVTRQSVLDDPAKVQALADLTRRAVQVLNWQQRNAEQWINASYVKQQGLTYEQGKYLYDKSGLGTYYPIENRLSQVYQQIADGLYETGALQKKVTIAPFLDARFNDIVASQNRLDGIVPKQLENNQHAVISAQSAPTPASASAAAAAITGVKSDTTPVALAQPTRVAP
ncbi:ABC transporter substrate-binding protein [Advenella mimigardefordensis]|uniref:Putative ABC-type aliphatic sulfonates-binding protein n=1 Tax=Advenella mimigardefordensis (strain DSM 17166 / LMG 22922 / DPN7) TaxID=1247726 RepID=W0P6W5_ADVMD|nr:ABC transporter substrate-binding protein [Advenella mimigardefordensis]AHG62501.1 putative ABC-type aliphatic sulfonates-binding protein [Advenella mimigardefordensis DPN7]